jgi:putative tryptophan/tyrosine transport system substrate-binding protein
VDVRRLATSVCGLLILAVSARAEAQPPGKLWRIGYFAQAASAVGADTLGEFKRALGDLGYIEGQHYVLLVRDAGGQPERLQPLATELASAAVDIIVTASTPPALAALRATRSIPIVMAISADPVANGLVQSLARPGGNVTGMALAFDEISRKWLELLMAVRAPIARVVVLSNPTNESMRVMLQPLDASARVLSVKLSVHELAPGASPDTVLDSVRRERPDALVVLPDAFLRTHITRIAETAARMRAPAIYGNGAYVDAGGLMSYGADQRQSYRRAAAYVDRILKGAKPADLPVERPTKFELVINQKAARAAGLTMPASILLQADRVIE